MKNYKQITLNTYLSKLFLVIFLCLFTIHSYSQEKNIIKGNQQWVQYYGQAKLNDKWTLLYDTGFRWRDHFEKKSQYLIRTSLGYSINPNIRFASGFANLGAYATQKPIKIEYRPYQELSIRNNYNKTELKHRLRIEERFIQSWPNSEYETQNTFNLRFRYAFMVGIPLFNLSKSDLDKKFILSIGDEIFINAGEKIVYNVFDQNRFVIATTIKHSKSLFYGLAWNNLFGGTNSPSTYVWQNVVWFQVKHKLDFSRNRI